MAKASTGVLFTIGHSNHPFADFLTLLRRHGIELVVDVRARPYSRFVPQFGKERLAKLLAEAGIGYLYLGRELGGRPASADAAAQAPNYAARIREPAFHDGIARLLTAAQAQRSALMCRERDPLDCHRLHLICRHLRADLGNICHILPDGCCEPQAATEQRLLARSPGASLPLFESAEAEDALERAYDRWWQR